jgi:hypothetical protein
MLLEVRWGEKKTICRLSFSLTATAFLNSLSNRFLVRDYDTWAKRVVVAAPSWSLACVTKHNSFTNK